MKKEKSCGAIVINSKNQVLLVKHNAGHYGFPKGHMNPHETELETAIREVKEETNLDIIIDNPDKKYVITYQVGKNVTKDVIFFLAKPISNDVIPQLSEVSEVIWVDISNVVNYLEFDNIISLWQNKISNDLKDLSKNNGGKND